MVNRATNEVTSVDILYSVNTKKEPTGLIDPGVPVNTDYLTGSTVSISDLLDFVNTKDGKETMTPKLAAEKQKFKGKNMEQFFLMKTLSVLFDAM